MAKKKELLTKKSQTLGGVPVRNLFQKNSKKKITGEYWSFLSGKWVIMSWTVDGWAENGRRDLDLCEPPTDVTGGNLIL